MQDHSPAQLKALLFAAASPELDLTFRLMFGGIMAYAQGRPFASLSNVGLALKLAGADYHNLLEVPGAAPLRYEPGKPASRSYVVVPLSIVGDPALLAHWAGRSARHAIMQPPKTARRTR